MLSDVPHSNFNAHFLLQTFVFTDPWSHLEIDFITDVPKSKGNFLGLVRCEEKLRVSVSMPFDYHHRQTTRSKGWTRRWDDFYMLIVVTIMTGQRISPGPNSSKTCCNSWPQTSPWGCYPFLYPWSTASTEALDEWFQGKEQVQGSNRLSKANAE